jgi:capsule polysaccharide export protein KpsE/RkpR
MDLLVGLSVILAIAFLPFLNAISRKYTHGVKFFCWNFIVFITVILAILYPSGLTISIAVIFWILLLIESTSSDNRDRTVQLKNQLKSIKFCPSCLQKLEVQDLYQNEDWPFLCNIYNLTSHGMSKSIQHEIEECDLDFESSKSYKMFVNEYDAVFTDVISFTNKFCPSCRSKINKIVRKYVESFVNFEFDHEMYYKIAYVKGTIKAFRYGRIAGYESCVKFHFNDYSKIKKMLDKTTTPEQVKKIGDYIIQSATENKYCDSCSDDISKSEKCYAKKLLSKLIQEIVSERCNVQKECPLCFELIDANASTCPYCAENLE